MRAVAGDKVVIRGHRIGTVPRSGVIVEVRGEDGAPPYLVRWEGDPHEHLFYPGSDADIEHAADD
jgi:hypothetical protein